MDYDQGILAVPRRLFSQNYIDGGCEGEPPKNTTTDDTLGCCASAGVSQHARARRRRDDAYPTQMRQII